jgi:hypothetical protein
MLSFFVKEPQPDYRVQRCRQVLGGTKKEDLKGKMGFPSKKQYGAVVGLCV